MFLNVNKLSVGKEDIGQIRYLLLEVKGNIRIV